MVVSVVVVVHCVGLGGSEVAGMCFCCYQSDSESEYEILFSPFLGEGGGAVDDDVDVDEDDDDEVTWRSDDNGGGEGEGLESEPVSSLTTVAMRPAEGDDERQRAIGDPGGELEVTSIVSEVDDPKPAAEELADEEVPLFTSSSCERGGVGGESTTIREDEEMDREADEVVVAEEEDVVAVNDELRWTMVFGTREVVEEAEECVTVVLDEAGRSGVDGGVTRGMGRVQPSLLQISTMMESHSPWRK